MYVMYLLRLTYTRGQRQLYQTAEDNDIIGGRSARRAHSTLITIQDSSSAKSFNTTSYNLVQV